MKKIFSLSFFFSLSLASLLSSFFLLIFFSLPHLRSASLICSGDSSSSLSPIFSRFVFIANLHLHLHHRSLSSLPMSSSHAASPSRPVLHLVAYPMPTSLVLHLTANPSSIANLNFIANPSSTGTAFIELKSTVGFSGFHDGGLAGFHGG